VHSWTHRISERGLDAIGHARMTVAVANEPDYPMDLAALNRVIATDIATLA
jgi:hypothetical protein